jgi:hypothetical protein
MSTSIDQLFGELNSVDNSKNRHKSFSPETAAKQIERGIQ